MPFCRSMRCPVSLHNEIAGEAVGRLDRCLHNHGVANQIERHEIQGVCMPFEHRKWAEMIDDDLVLRAKAFVNSVEAGVPPAAIEAFYHPDIVQEEYPNLLLPNGAVRRFDDLRAANETARSILRSQRFEIINAVRCGYRVALESLWAGTFSVAIGTLPAGAPMRARFAQFFEFRDGLIWRLRNYDCFDPF